MNTDDVAPLETLRATASGDESHGIQILIAGERDIALLIVREMLYHEVEIGVLETMEVLVRLGRDERAEAGAVVSH